MARSLSEVRKMNNQQIANALVDKDEQGSANIFRIVSRERVVAEDCDFYSLIGRDYVGARLGNNGNGNTRRQEPEINIHDEDHYLLFYKHILTTDWPGTGMNNPRDIRASLEAALVMNEHWHRLPDAARKFYKSVKFHFSKWQARNR